MEIQNNNAWAAITVLVLIAITFTAYYFAVPVHGLLYAKFMNESKYSGYVSESTCKNAGGTWESGECKPLPERAMNLIDYSRHTWLIAPFIFVVGLIFWFIVVALRRDPREYSMR